MRNEGFLRRADWPAWPARRRPEMMSNVISSVGSCPWVIRYGCQCTPHPLPAMSPAAGAARPQNTECRPCTPKNVRVVNNVRNIPCPVDQRGLRIGLRTAEGRKGHIPRVAGNHIFISAMRHRGYSFHRLSPRTQACRRPTQIGRAWGIDCYCYAAAAATRRSDPCRCSSSQVSPRKCRYLLGRSLRRCVPRQLTSL